MLSSPSSLLLLLLGCCCCRCLCAVTSTFGTDSWRLTADIECVCTATHSSVYTHTHTHTYYTLLSPFSSSYPFANHTTAFCIKCREVRKSSASSYVTCIVVWGLLILFSLRFCSAATLLALLLFFSFCSAAYATFLSLSFAFTTRHLVLCLGLTLPVIIALNLMFVLLFACAGFVFFWGKVLNDALTGTWINWHATPTNPYITSSCSQLNFSSTMWTKYWTNLHCKCLNKYFYAPSLLFFSFSLALSLFLSLCLCPTPTTLSAVQFAKGQSLNQQSTSKEGSAEGKA